MAFVPTAGRRRVSAGRSTAATVSKVASLGACAFAFAFTTALVLGLIP